MLAPELKARLWQAYAEASAEYEHSAAEFNRVQRSLFQEYNSIALAAERKLRREYRPSRAQCADFVAGRRQVWGRPAGPNSPEAQALREARSTAAVRPPLQPELRQGIAFSEEEIEQWLAPARAPLGWIQTIRGVISGGPPRPDSGREVIGAVR